MRFAVEVSLPPVELTPNRRNRRGGFWAATHAQKTWQSEVVLSALAALGQRYYVDGMPWKQSRISLEVWWPARQRRWDNDALIAAMKPGIDVLTAGHKDGVGIIVDDGPDNLTWSTIVHHRLLVPYGGKVVIGIEKEES